MIFRYVAMSLALVLFAPALASAACRSGEPPSYDDIEAVLYKQEGGAGSIGNVYAAYASPHFRVNSFAASAFWVSFWETDRVKFPTEYVQLDLKDAVGSYELSATLSQMRDLLRRDDFYSLSPSGAMITDVPWAVLSVKRCAVTTIIAVYNIKTEYSDPATEKLFADLRSLVQQSKKILKNKKPHDFPESGLFNPLPDITK
jgi:hypothetical protein